LSNRTDIKGLFLPINPTIHSRWAASINEVMQRSFKPQNTGQYRGGPPSFCLHVPMHRDGSLCKEVLARQHRLEQSSEDKSQFDSGIPAFTIAAMMVKQCEGL